MLLRGAYWIGGVLLVGGLMVGCTSASEEPARPSPDTSRTVASPVAADTASGPEARVSDTSDRSLEDKLADARVEARVKQALMQQRSLRVFEFQVAVVRGRVVLQGDVNTRDEYEEAARMARRVEGVSDVRNEVTVGGEPVGEGEPAEEQAAASGNEANDAGAVYHTVDAGDSLWRIAQQYGTSIQRLRDLNDLSGGGLQPGQRIRVR